LTTEAEGAFTLQPPARRAAAIAAQAILFIQEKRGKKLDFCNFTKFLRELTGSAVRHWQYVQKGTLLQSADIAGTSYW
jgi:hypothetical protein